MKMHLRRHLPCEHTWWVSKPGGRCDGGGAASIGMSKAAEEEDISHEDLSVLSAKLKRILNEEARRHGIDV